MTGDGDRRERREAARLFAAVAAAVLIVVGAAVVFLLSGSLENWAEDAFGAGLGLRDSAVIAFIVAFVSIIVLTVASGGDALLGELPFTLIGFFAFFVFCWLMIAWIF